MNKPESEGYKRSMRNYILVFLICVLCAVSSVFGQAPSGKDGELESYQIDGDTYVKSGSLAKFLGGSESIDFLGKNGKTEFNGVSLEYSLFSPLIKSGDDIYNIYKPVIFQNGTFLLPIKYLVSVLNKVSNQQYAWGSNGLSISNPQFNVTGISASQKINGLLIELYMKDNLRFDAMKTDDNWLAVTISNGKIDSMAFRKRIPARAIYDVKTYQFDNSCQVSIRLRPRDFTYTAKVKDDPLRIQFLIRGEGFSDSAMIAEEKAPISDNPIDIIVIDPGHGGDDNGAIGPSGTKEKDITLKIAKDLEKLLNNDGRFTTVMTRDNDTFIPLAQRASIANSAGGDLFISIHANAAKNKKANGVMAFSLADAKTDEARAAATLENSSIRFEKVEERKQYNTDLDFTLRDMVQTEYQRESVDLADIMEKDMVHATGVDSRGIDQAGFFVLDKAYMPAVLLETAFISNKQDEKKLKSDDFQQKTAKAIYDAIVSFKERYESQNGSSR
jgi:N-acetylmuramoyl-L-alanine amidase